MRNQKFALFAWVLLLVLGVVAVQAAGSQGAAFTSLDESKPNENGPAVSLGQPGTVFRYEETFGETGVAYLADDDHFYQPMALGLDGAGNVWVAEGQGSRVMKFSGDGTCLLVLGTAGLSFLADETHFAFPTDVSIDGNGNVWVVDDPSARVVKLGPDGNYLMQLGVTWESGNDNSHFNEPTGVAFDSAGNIYVNDQLNHRIQVFDSSGAYSATIGETGVPGTDNDHFNWPTRIAVDSNDYLYVTDTYNHRVQVFDDEHDYVATLGVTGEPGSDNDHFNRPRGVAVDADFIYVTDQDNHRVQIFDRTTYTYQDTLGSYGFGDYEFDNPFDVAVDAAGNVYVVDTANQRVQKYDSSLVYVRTFGITGVPYLTDGYHYNQPVDVAVDVDGNIAIVEDDGRGERLIKLDAAGMPLFTIGEAGVPGSDNDHFAAPVGVAFDGSGNIYVAECGNHRVQIFSSTGIYSATLGTGYGQGNDQFACPSGMAFDGSGNLYIADTANHRIQIFDSSLSYVTTLGETGVSGSDNDHFNEPSDVAVDSAGNIYVADTFNERVQKFDSGLSWQMTLGVTGECGYDFEHLCVPKGLAVDGSGKVYVSEWWNPRVQVFDTNGAYLTTIGGAWGNLSSQFRHLPGVAVDSAGNVYIADMLNHRVQKFAPGVPDWQQVNINGFGERYAVGITALEAFNGQLYAGTATSWEMVAGAQVYRTGDGVAWSAVSEPGFGVYTDTISTILDLAVFDGKLYAGAGWGNIQGQIWRSPDGVTWEPVTTDGFGDGGNKAVSAFAVFDGMFYAGTANEGGAQIWRSSSGNSGDWTMVAPDEPGTEDVSVVTSLTIYKGSLYAAVEGETTAQVWRSANGSGWDTVVPDGFGDANNRGTGGFAEFGGYLYLGTWNDVSGAQVWRSADGTTWQQVVSDGFGDIANVKVEMLVTFAGRLYAEVNNEETGLEMLRLGNGMSWERLNPDGFGDSNNFAILWKNSTAVFQNRLHFGTWNLANGGEIWRYDLPEQRIYLPTIQH